MKISSKLKETLKEFCSGCTAHGLANIAKTDSYLFLFIWIIALLSAIAASVYFTLLSIFDYLEFSTTVNYQIRNDEFAEFPSITICNLYPFDPATNQYSSEYIKYILKKNSIEPKLNVSEDEDAITKVNFYSTFIKALVMSEKNFSRYYLSQEDIGFTMKTMLISCFFNGRKCNSSDFQWSFSFEYGNCYTFNYKGNKIEKTRISGPNSGLSLELYIGKERLQDFYSEKSGIFVHVHNTTSSPHVRYGGVSVQSGTATNIEISRVFYSKLSSPYSNCKADLKMTSTDNEFFKKTASLDSYSQKLCFDLVKQIKLVKANCNCFHPSLPTPIDDKTSLCNNNSSLICAEIQIKNSDYIVSEDECPMECNKIDYLLSANSAFYPTAFYSNLLITKDSIKAKFNPKYSLNETNPSIFENTENTQTPNKQGFTRLSQQGPPQNNVSQNDLFTSCLKVSIYYGDLSYIYIEEDPAVTWESLLGTVGGQFGLFVGASFLTILEFVELVYSLFWILKDGSEKKKISNLNFNPSYN